jgi:hypothetical protein
MFNLDKVLEVVFDLAREGRLSWDVANEIMAGVLIDSAPSKPVKPEGLPQEREHSWGRVYISDYATVGQRQMDDGSIQYLCHNEALCNPYYLATKA